MSAAAHTLKVRIVQDEAYRAVFAEGAAAVATNVEKIIYSAASSVELVSDLHALIQSARCVGEMR